MPRPTTDIAEWLGRQGLGQYAQTFAENHIDYSVLPDLTEDDLEKLGISWATARYCSGPSTKSGGRGKRATQRRLHESARKQPPLRNIATPNFVRSR